MDAGNEIEKLMQLARIVNPRNRSVQWAGANWNRYSIFFAASAALMLVALALARRLVEPEAASMDALLREILLHSPQRILVRIWPRE